MTFLGVRIGCFLSGCDYGIPTASFGVRFPGGSLAAIDHAERGCVPLGAPGLPVHPTGALWGVPPLAPHLSPASTWPGSRRDGTAFLSWIGLYALGRFLNEFLRGDESRGLYLGLSSAQYISLALCGIVAAILVQRLFAQRSGSTLWSSHRCQRSQASLNSGAPA